MGAGNNSMEVAAVSNEAIDGVSCAESVRARHLTREEEKRTGIHHAPDSENRTPNQPHDERRPRHVLRSLTANSTSDSKPVALVDDVAGHDDDGDAERHEVVVHCSPSTILTRQSRSSRANHVREEACDAVDRSQTTNVSTDANLRY